LKCIAAFLNTGAGILLLGVNDNGEITGLEQDVFGNEDKCKSHFKNLIAQHIGVVVCARSSESVFLKSKRNFNHLLVKEYC
jgi:predicted HTH transcriptional regulator